MIGFMWKLAKATTLDDIVPLLPARHDLKHALTRIMLPNMMISKKIAQIAPHDLQAVQKFTHACPWHDVNMSAIRTYIHQYGIATFCDLCTLLKILFDDVGRFGMHPYVYALYEDIVGQADAYHNCEQLPTFETARDLLDEITRFIDEQNEKNDQQAYPHLWLIAYMLIERLPFVWSASTSVKEIIDAVNVPCLVADAIMMILSARECTIDDLIIMLKDPVFEPIDEPFFEMFMACGGHMTCKKQDLWRAYAQTPGIMDAYLAVWKKIMLMLARDPLCVTREQLRELAGMIYDVRGNVDDVRPMEETVITAMLQLPHDDGDDGLAYVHDANSFATQSGKHRFIVRVARQCRVLRALQYHSYTRCISSPLYGGDDALRALQKIRIEG